MFNFFESSIDGIVKQFTKAVAKLEAHAEKHDAKAQEHMLHAMESLTKHNESVREVSRAKTIAAKIEGMIA